MSTVLAMTALHMEGEELLLEKTVISNSFIWVVLLLWFYWVCGFVKTAVAVTVITEVWLMCLELDIVANLCRASPPPPICTLILKC